MSSLEELEYNRTVLLDDDLAFIELETLQGITSIHLVPRRFGSYALRDIRDIFDEIKEELRKSGISKITNLIDPSPKLDKLHRMFGFTKVGSWRELDVYEVQF